MVTYLQPLILEMMTLSDTYHVPIMADQVIKLLKPENCRIAVDGTLGGGGHAIRMLQRMPEGATLYGIDRDPEAIEAATARINAELDNTSGKSFIPIRGNFFDMKKLLEARGVYKVDAVLLDLGVSSRQFDAENRGFSYRYPNAQLDMRMDTDANFTAKDLVNTYSEDELCRVFRDYGEERYARQIARNIVRWREKKLIETTGELEAIVKASLPEKILKTKGHPCRTVFQAIRIEVNGELDGLEGAVESAVDILNTDGRIAVITFHSLEDRILKTLFKRLQNPCTCDPKAPICTCGKVPTVEPLTKKPIIADEAELERNPRARSAKLRAVRKL